MSTQSDHASLANSLKQRVLDGPGETDVALRRRVAERATGGPPIEPPFDDLARQIAEPAYRTTDAHIAAVVTAAGSEKAAFEVIAVAATGAGLLRWQQALNVLSECDDAPA